MAMVVRNLAEATLAPGQATERHYHRLAEEIYYIVEGAADMEVDGDRRRIIPGDAVLIPPGDAVLTPPGAWHTIRADDGAAVRLLCCCAPAYTLDDTFFD